MARKKDIRNKNGWADRAFYENEEERIAREKRKARELRKSAWWRKKISTGICYYCGQEFLPAELTMDHRIPITRGGRSEKINLVPACKECNNKKKYLLPTEWEDYIDALKKQKLC